MHQYSMSRPNQEPLKPSGKEGFLHAISMHPKLGIASDIAQHVCQMIASHWGRVSNITEKAPGDLVSVLDNELDQYVVRCLKSTSPESTVISEESWTGGETGDGPTWVVDPLDGTTAFLKTKSRDIPAFMIAYLEQGVVQCCLIAFPLTEQVYYAARGMGAWCNGAQVKWEPIGDAHWLRVNRYGDPTFESQAVARLLDSARGGENFDLVTVEPPSAGMACWLTPGSALVHDNNPLKPKQGPWDVAAPLLFVTEAGGAVLTLEGQPLSLAEIRPYVVGTSRALAERVVRLAQAHDEPTRGVRLRLAKNGEGAALMQFLLKSGQSEWNHLPHDEIHEQGQAIERGEVRAVVAERYGNIIGVVTYYRQDEIFKELDADASTRQRRGYVAEATVAPEMRGKGVGSQMLKLAVAMLARQGVQAVYAKRHADNEGSAGMMRKAGLTPLSTFTDPEIRKTGSRQTTVERLLL